VGGGVDRGSYLATLLEIPARQNERFPLYTAGKNHTHPGRRAAIRDGHAGRTAADGDNGGIGCAERVANQSAKRLPIDRKTPSPCRSAAGPIKGW
jgi:hypothetical protein